MVSRVVACLAVAALTVWGTVALWPHDRVVSGAATTTATTRTTTTKKSATAKRTATTPASNRSRATVDDARTTVRDGAGPAWRVARMVLAVGVIALGLLLAVRTWARRRRHYVRLRLIPYRADEAVPDVVRRLVESWHQQLLERWWRRPLLGQPSIALELTMAPGASGELEGQMAIVCPIGSVDSIAASLRSCYPDSRLTAAAPMLRSERVVRLKKRFVFLQPLSISDKYDGSVADTVLNQLANTGQPGVVQYVLTPVPGAFDRWSRSRFRARERRSMQSAALSPSDPGLRSELMSHEFQGGLAVQHHTLFFGEIRVGAQTLPAARSVAASLRGRSVGLNRLVERSMRRLGRGPLYCDRIMAGLGNPLPSWRHGVLSSAEVAELWHLPSPGLTAVRLHRSSIPRAIAPPAITRDPVQALARDEHGFVGIRAVDKSDGLGLIGGQKTGKTSVLCRTVQVDAADEDCAMVVLMPKPGDALKALSMVPRGRKVHFLDFAAPEFGINPLLAVGEPAAVADKIVEAFRDVNEEGDIRGSSDRFLRQAAQAAVGAGQAGVLPGPASLWDMYRMLLPSEVAFRERVVQALYSDPRFTDTVTFFGRDLPHDLRETTVNATSKLDAPRNKLLRLLVESLDKVLRHPVQLSLDEVVRNREILIVDGKMGTFGPDNCRVMMQFILNMLYGALQRQQQLPDAERVRVAVKVDEAHLIMNESFANALATLRSAGLEVVAAWQYGEQIQDPKIRAGLMSLLRQRCMFSMGESADAREMSEMVMNVYVDMIKDDPSSRARVRMTPDVIYNLPNHHALCSWISEGARQPGFILQTIPLETDQAIVDHHLQAQRDRGAFVPDRMPDPLPELALDGVVDIADRPLELGDALGEEVGAVAAAAPPAPPRAARPVPVAVPQREQADADVDVADDVLLPESIPEPEPVAIAVPAAERRPPVRPPVGAPETFVELDLDAVRGIAWDEIATQKPEEWPEPTARDLEILAALHRHRVMFSTQIWRRWWGTSTLRAAQQGLNRMAKAGWVRRFKFLSGERGAVQRVYCITQAGFALAQSHSGPKGPYIHPETEWRELGVDDPRAVVRNLHANGWVLALEALAPRAVTHWRGPGDARILVPRRRARGEWVEWRPSELVIGTSRRVHNLQAERLEPVSPAAAVELRVQGADGRRRFDLLIEIQRGRLGPSQVERLARYDAFITGWFRLVDRYQTLKTPPIVVFVCEDEPSAIALAELADGALTGQIAKAGTEAHEWPAPARRTIFFAAERAIHEGSLEAFKLQPLPPELRTDGDTAFAPRKVAIVDPRMLGVRRD